MTTVRERTTEMIGPGMASELLAYNTHNRTMSRTRVERYVQAMRDGRWANNHDPIKIFCIDGGPTLLMSGQKRLTAIQQSGCTYEFDVLWLSGTREECEREFAITDGQEPRSARNSLETGFDIDRGGYAVKDIAIAARAIIFLEWLVEGNEALWQSATNEDVVRVVHEHPEEVHFGCAIRVAFRRGMHRVAPHGVLAAAVDARRHDAERALAFYVRVGEQQNIASGMPEYTLARYLGGLKLISGYRQQLPIFTLSNYAWNAHVEGRTLTRFSPRPGVVRAIAPRAPRMLTSEAV